MPKRITLISPLIIVMIMSAIQKHFMDYQRWPTIIVAISVASWFLALSDFCLNQTQALQTNVDEQLSASKLALRKATRIREYAQKRQIQQTIAEQAVDEIQRYVSIEQNVLSLKKNVSKYYRNLQKAVKGNKRNCVIGYILAALGYIFLVGRMFWGTNVEPGSIDLDELTIWSFIFTLLGYAFGDLQSEHRTKQKKDSEKAISALDALEEELKDEVANCAD